MMSTIQAIAFRRNKLGEVRKTFHEIERPGVIDQCLSPQHRIIREPADDDTAYEQRVDLISHAALLFQSVRHDRRTGRS